MPAFEMPTEAEQARLPHGVRATFHRPAVSGNQPHTRREALILWREAIGA